MGETVEALIACIEGRGAKVFGVVDHSGEAEQVGLELRDTLLVIFGSPAAGTGAMVASPTVALDLPLKILVWAEHPRWSWMTYLDPEWLAARHGLDPEAARAMSAVDAVTAEVASHFDQQARDAEDERLDEVEIESFPASDPHADWAGPPSG